MSVSVKRKRGRPRLDEPREIKDFDNNLIQEFKKFPVFYDRQHPQHRNREHTDRIWQEIAKNLNVSTNLAKTRMLQLRNRFNLEKRRVEAMQEHHNSSVGSQWSLYDRLSFLSNYVKSRRPYSIPTNSNPRVGSVVSTSGGEQEDDIDELEDEVQENVYNNNQISNGVNITNEKRIVDGLSADQNRLSTANLSQHQLQRSLLPPVGEKDFSSKYKAFGQFLASSLIEMKEVQALNLVEKFTTNIVKYLKTEERKRSLMESSQKSNTDDGDDENSLTVY